MNDWINLLRLWRSYSIGPFKFKKLIEKFGSAQEVILSLTKKDIDITSEDGRIWTISKNILISEYEIQKEIENVYNFGASFISIYDEIWPKYLNENFEYPCILTVKGDLNLLKKECIAVVGSRNSSISGKKWTEKFVKDICNDFCIVSGLARGIDSVAHINSLKTGTIGILASGINKIYPEENKELYDEISKKGVLISEFNFGEEPQSSYFSRRNRVIAGISWGTIVVEADLKSGSLITGYAAMDQGKEVFAVPNHPFDLRSRGVNKLLKEGANLIENSDDFYSVYSHIGQRFLKDHKLNISKTKLNSNALTLNKKSQIDFISENLDLNNKELNPKNFILSLFGKAPLSIDEILIETSFTLKETLQILMDLELDGIISRDLNGMVYKV